MIPYFESSAVPPVARTTSPEQNCENSETQSETAQLESRARFSDNLSAEPVPIECPSTARRVAYVQNARTKTHQKKRLIPTKRVLHTIGTSTLS